MVLPPRSVHFLILGYIAAAAVVFVVMLWESNYYFFNIFLGYMHDFKILAYFASFHLYITPSG